MAADSNKLITDETGEIISRSPLFIGLKPEVIAGIIENAYEMDFEAGHFIIEEGDPLLGLCIIIDGETSIEKKNNATGETTELHTRGVGESLGEMTLIDLGTRSMSVRAKSNIKIAVINLEYLSSLFDEDPKTLATVAVNIARILSRRLRETEQDS